MTFLISYDVTSDKKRNKLSKYLEELGVRLQFSVFECNININKLKSIKSKIEEIINMNKDSVLIYQLCGSCSGKKIQIGKEYVVKSESIIIS